MTKPHLFRLPLAVWLLVAAPFVSPRPVAAADAAGHWEGAVKLPATELEIKVDLERGVSQVWEGRIDIPVQGLRGFKLGAVNVSGSSIAFGLPGIPGEPQFGGRIAADGQSIAGDFSQAGQTFPFRLERKGKPAPVVGETPSRGLAGEGPLGHWQGSLKPTPVVELRLALELTQSPAGGLAGVLVSMDQGGVRIPLTAVTEREGVVRLEAKSVGGAFAGKLNRDGSELVGEWTQGGGSVPLVFMRLAAAPTLRRPQEPTKPYPYTEEEVAIQSPTTGVTLAGTLTLPRASGPHPAVILFTGSGAQDRDEAIRGHRPFLVLADHLTRRGIAVLRCDDRGVGQSTGDFARATLADFVEDALTQVAWLARRQEIHPRKIGLLGHSEGGITAPRAALRSTNVAFLVLLAGVGVPMEDLLVRQGQDIGRVLGADADTLAKNAELQRAIFRVVKEEKDLAAAETALRKLMSEQIASLTPIQRNALGLTDATIEGQIKTVLSPWFRDLLVYDPRPTLKAVKRPVLALNGERDLQVSARENLAAIRQALADGGNYNVRTIELPGLNHLFQTCKTGAVAEYGQIEETFNPAALKEISAWILSTTAR